jgi:5-methylthioadenosine/S-adenosylhomocysteine deaminase
MRHFSLRLARLTWIIALTVTLAAPHFARAAVETVDIVIRNGAVVTMDPERRVIENGLVAIRGERIVAVGSAATLAGRYRARTVIDATGKAVMPGLVNAHTHVPMTLFRGVADDLPLQQWLQNYIFPAEAKNVTREFVRAGTRLGCLEMIRGGVTCFVDMYYFEDEIAAVVEVAGMRAVLGETIIDFPVPDAANPQKGLEYAEQFIEKYKSGHPLITPAVAPHAPYTCAPATLAAARRLADKHGVPLVTHLLEDVKETDIIRERYGARPLAYVEKSGLLGPRMIAAHVVQVTPEEIPTLKKFDIGVAHCPQSNMKLAAGVAPVTELLAGGVAVGLGTDGAASNNDLDMFEEMDAAAKLHKVTRRDPTAVPAQTVIEMATIVGARAIHKEKEIGSLEAGKLADVIIVNLSAPHQLPVYNLYSTLAYATKSGDVATSVINGKIVMRDRTPLTLDARAIRREAAEYRRRVWESLKTK